MYIQGEIKLIAQRYFHHINNEILGTYVQEQLAKPPLNPSDRTLQVSLVGLLADRYPQAIDRYNYNKFDFHEVYNFVHFDLIPFLPALQKKQSSISHQWNISQFLKKHKHKIRQFIFHMSALEKHWIQFKGIEHPLTDPLFHTIQQYFDQFTFTHYHLSITKSENDEKWMKTFLRSQFEKVDNLRFEQFYTALIQWEYYITLAKTIVRNQFCYASFTETKAIQIQGLYHPLVANPVKNDIDISARVILLTGANMSGKSAFLKSIYLLYYFTLRGFPIWCDRATLPEVSDCNIINVKEDQIAAQQSHFANELNQLKSMILQNNQAPIVGILDELFNTTNAEDAKVIITKTINGLIKKPHGIFFISSHIAALEAELTPSDTLKVYYLDSYIEDEQPIFTYQLKAGWNSINLGQQLFQQIGLNTLLD